MYIYLVDIETVVKDHGNFGDDEYIRKKQKKILTYIIIKAMHKTTSIYYQDQCGRLEFSKILIFFIVIYNWKQNWQIISFK